MDSKRCCPSAEVRGAGSGSGAGFGFWVWVWGPLGGLLSVPLTIVVRLVLERSEELHWVSVLLGSSVEHEVAPPPARRKVLAKVRLPKGVPPESILRTDALDKVRLEEGDPSASVAAGDVISPEDSSRLHVEDSAPLRLDE